MALQLCLATLHLPLLAPPCLWSVLHGPLLRPFSLPAKDELICSHNLDSPWNANSVSTAHQALLLGLSLPTNST